METKEDHLYFNKRGTLCVYIVLCLKAFVAN